jgi:hypothetical protein
MVANEAAVAKHAIVGRSVRARSPDLEVISRSIDAARLPSEPLVAAVIHKSRGSLAMARDAIDILKPRHRCPQAAAFEHAFSE